MPGTREAIDNSIEKLAATRQQIERMKQTGVIASETFSDVEDIINSMSSTLGEISDVHNTIEASIRHLWEPISRDITRHIENMESRFRNSTFTSVVLTILLAGTGIFATTYWGRQSINSANTTIIQTTQKNKETLEKVLSNISTQTNTKAIVKNPIKLYYYGEEIEDKVVLNSIHLEPSCIKFPISFKNFGAKGERFKNFFTVKTKSPYRDQIGTVDISEPDSDLYTEQRVGFSNTTYVEPGKSAKTANWGICKWDYRGVAPQGHILKNRIPFSGKETIDVSLKYKVGSMKEITKDFQIIVNAKEK